jgi:hypothetical protein
VHIVVKNPGLFVRGEVHGPILRRDRAAVDGAEVPIGPLGQNAPGYVFRDLGNYRVTKGLQAFGPVA